MKLENARYSEMRLEEILQRESNKYEEKNYRKNY